MPARILFVTGKGGTGKSTVAAALADEARRRRIDVLLVRMPGSAVEEAATGASPQRRHEKILDRQEELTAFLARLLPLSFLARRLTQSRTFSAVAAAAPGLADLVALSAVVTAAEARRGLVVVDAPATGHAVPLLSSPSRVLALAGLGPVAGEARRALEALASPRRFVALLVATAEELPLLELRTLRDAMEATGVAAWVPVVNALWPEHVRSADAARILGGAAPADAAWHLRTGRRQAALVAELEREVGSCSRLAFRFDGAEASAAGRSDVVTLFDRVAGRKA